MFIRVVFILQHSCHIINFRNRGIVLRQFRLICILLLLAVLTIIPLFLMVLVMMLMFMLMLMQIDWGVILLLKPFILMPLKLLVALVQFLVMPHQLVIFLPEWFQINILVLLEKPNVRIIVHICVYPALPLVLRGLLPVVIDLVIWEIGVHVDSLSKGVLRQRSRFKPRVVFAVIQVPWQRCFYKK